MEKIFVVSANRWLYQEMSIETQIEGESQRALLPLGRRQFEMENQSFIFIEERLPPLFLVFKGSLWFRITKSVEMMDNC